MDADLFFRFIAFVFLMGCSAFFSASETAFFSLSRFRVQSIRREGRIGGRIGFLLDRPRRLIISILMGNEIVNIASSAVFTGTFVAVMGDDVIWLAPVLMAPLLMIFGEITPKSVAARFPESFSRFFVIPLSLFARIIAPLRWVFLQISNGILTLLGTPPRARSNILMEDEFLTLVEAGHEEGQLDAMEKAYIRNIFEFHDRTVGEITIPRPDMVCIEAETPLEEVADYVRAAPHSRIPVYQGDRDNIVGILYVKDFLRLARRKSFVPGERLTEKMWRAPLVVPEGLKLDALFRLFRQRRTHIAVVVDEFGGVAGLVTMKDLLEEIFGKIRDEFDELAEAEMVQEPDGAYVCLARVPLWEFTEKTGWRVPTLNGANTLGGLVSTLMGYVPKKGDRVHAGGIEFTVLDVARNRVLRVRAEKRREGEA